MQYTNGSVHLPPGINQLTFNLHLYGPFRIKLPFLLLAHFYFTQLLFGTLLQFQDKFCTLQK